MRRLWVVLGAAVIIAMMPSAIAAQAQPDFSGKWRFNQAKSSRGASGTQPDIGFPSDLVIKHAQGQMRVEMTTIRQAAMSANYKLDGSQVAVDAPEGITETAKASWDGPKLVIAGRRSFTSPILGEVVAETREVWTLSGNVLTVEKTRTAGGESDTETGVYDRMPAGS